MPGERLAVRRPLHGAERVPRTVPQVFVVRAGAERRQRRLPLVQAEHHVLQSAGRLQGAAEQQDSAAGQGVSLSRQVRRRDALAVHRREGCRRLGRRGGRRAGLPERRHHQPALRRQRRKGPLQCGVRRHRRCQPRGPHWLLRSFAERCQVLVCFSFLFLFFSFSFLFCFSFRCISTFPFHPFYVKKLIFFSSFFLFLFLVFFLKNNPPPPPPHPRPNSLDKTIPPPKSVKAPCFNEIESRELLKARERLTEDEDDEVRRDVPNMPPRRECSCKNEGVCDAGGLCQCPSGWGGKECEEEVEIVPEFATLPGGETIVPGFEGNDVWTMGGRRTIEFQVNDYSSSQKTQNVKVWLFNRYVPMMCGGNREKIYAMIQRGVRIPPQSPLGRAFSLEVGTVDLARASGGAKQFKATIDFELTGEPSCIVPNANWQVYIESVEEPDEGMWAKGPTFKVEYAGCVSEAGNVGMCMNRGTCSGRQFRGLAAEPIQFGQCGASGECCVPTHAESDGSPLFSWFIFTSPTSDDREPYFAHSKTTVRWKHKSGSRWGFCDISDESTFQLRLYKATGLLSDDLLQSEFGTPKVTDKSFDLSLEGLSEGTYYFVARFDNDDGCSYKSDKFEIVNPGCQADPTTTITGSCVKQGSCIEDSTPSASGCDGLQGPVECCKPKRGAFSPNFRGSGEGTLTASGSAVALGAGALAAGAALLI